MSTPVFVLRPEPGLSATMARGTQLGLKMIAMPLSRAEPLDWQVPPGRFDGILLGSANGLRHAGEQLQAIAGLPVYAVGEATARHARELGLAVARTGEGGLQALVDALPPDPPLRLLRLAGAEHLPLGAPALVSIHTATTYEIVHRALEREEIAQLSKGGIVLLHSGESARHFALECDRAGVDRGALALAALAPRIARSASDGWQSVAVAPTPQDAALLSLAGEMCH
jgi:uroporphyrinogen-III synthase